MRHAMRSAGLLIGGSAVVLFSGWAAAPSAASSAGVGTSATPAITPWRDLGTLGGASSYPLALNNRGDVAGISQGADGRTYPFLWRDGVMRNLSQRDQGAAVAVNERGEVAGVVTSDSGDERAFLWRKGKVTELGTLGGTRARVRDLNNRGDVTGTSTVRGDGRTWAYLWHGGVMTRLADRGGTAFVNDINDRADVVGGWTNADESKGGAALWRHGRLIDLAPPFGTPGTAVATQVNDRGQVLGSVHSSTSDTWHSFLWTDGVYADLGIGTPVDLNDRGDVAAIDYSSELGLSFGRAARWHHGVLTILPGLGRRDGQVADVNERRQILGNLPATDGSQHAVVWSARDVLTDLGAVDGAVVHLNDRGRVLGYFYAPNDGQRAVVADLR